MTAVALLYLDRYISHFGRHRPRRIVYPAVGAVIALLAPLGLLLLQSILAGPAGSDPRWFAAELGAEGPTYAYATVSALSVFTSLGFVLGRMHDRLLELSLRDPVTGLFNRTYFRTRLTEEVSRAERYGTALSMMVIDLDGLKSINDNAGHEAGDRAISAVARAIARNLRTSDVAARWGGDEFTALLPETTVAEAEVLAERIRESSGGSDPARPRASVSIGIAQLDAGRQDARGLFVAADQALYAAKSGGRDRVALAPTTRRENRCRSRIWTSVG